MQQAPSFVVVGFKCSDQPKSRTHVSREPSQCSLLSSALTRIQGTGQPQQFYSEEYSDEYETDDEFFCDGQDGDMFSGNEQSSQSACSSLQSASFASSEPIPIPYKKFGHWSAWAADAAPVVRRAQFNHQARMTSLQPPARLNVKQQTVHHPQQKAKAL